MKELLQRITINPNVSGGKPSIRNMRFTVAQLLDLLAAGMKENEILEDYPFLEKEDIQACLFYASQLAAPRKTWSLAS
jgi:uncharacterized protein (DUF433 family)